MAKIFSQAQMDEIYAYFKDKVNSLECIEIPSLEPFSDCSFSKIASIVHYYYEGLFTLDQIQSVWNVGDSFTFTLPAISAINGLEAQPEQTIEMVIIDFNHNNLDTPIGYRTKSLLSFSSKYVLSSDGKLGDSSQDSYHANYWNDSGRRTWLNNTFYNSLPNDVKSIIKPVSRKMTGWTGIETFTDNVYLPTVKEVLGDNSGDAQVIGSVFEYYKTSTNRIKTHSDGTSVQNWTGQFYSLYENYYSYTIASNTSKDYKDGRLWSLGVPVYFDF